MSDPTKATITAGGNAVSGTQTLKVKELATGGYVTGGKLKKTADDEKVTSSDTLSSLGYTGSGKITIKGKDGSKDIDVSSTTSISDLVKQINDSGTGVKASFDADNQRIFISSLN